MSTAKPPRFFTDAQADVLVRLFAHVRDDILDATNRLREDLRMPIEKALPMPPKPKYRVQAPSRPWVP